MPGIVADPVRRLLLLGLAMVPLSGCYLLQAAAGQADVLARSEPIERVAADQRTAPGVRARLELARQAREFAVRELGLPDGRSFRRYADLDRPYAVWNVVATPEFSVAPRRWCFPVAGCVAYRGYFDPARAQAQARRLTQRGDDATVGGVATYSTLGRLPDPVFNTMLAWSEARFVGTIFHELAHERLYLPGASEFNEAFASVVEQDGVRRWFTAHGRPAEHGAYELMLAREAEFAHCCAPHAIVSWRCTPRARERCRCGSPSSGSSAGSSFEYSQLRSRWGGDGAYDGWFARVLNNAHLASVATYHDCVPGLRAELEAAGSLPAFYERAAQLGSLPEREWRAAVCTMSDARLTGSVGRR